MSGDVLTVRDVATGALTREDEYERVAALVAPRDCPAGPRVERGAERAHPGMANALATWGELLDRCAQGERVWVWDPAFHAYYERAPVGVEGA